MKRSYKCVEQTINLSKTCVKFPTFGKLVYDEVKKPCFTFGYKIPSYQTTKPVNIRLCSRQNLEKIYLHKAPQKLKPETKSYIIVRCIKFGFKSAIVASFAYWTSAEGFWGDGYETEDLYYRMTETMDPIRPGETGIENLELPNLDIIKHNVREIYNSAVFNIMKAVVTLPLIIKNKISNFIFSCDSLEDEDLLKGLRSMETEYESDSKE